MIQTIEQQLAQVIAKYFDIWAIQTSRAERALVGALKLLSLSIEHRHALRPCSQGRGLLEQPHGLEHLEGHAANVDRMTPPPKSRRAFNQRHDKSKAMQPVREAK